MAGRRATTRTTVGRRWGCFARARVGALLAAVALVLSGCGDNEPPEPTIEERLAEIEGRTLSPGEVAELLAVGDALCQLDDQVLEQVWLRLDDDQLAFQDLVFSERCSDRAILYAGHTGRYVTDEATESGVQTSTTRPATTTTRRTATTRAIETSRSGPAFTTTTNTTTASSTTTSADGSTTGTGSPTDNSSTTAPAAPATESTATIDPTPTAEGEGG